MTLADRIANGDINRAGSSFKSEIKAEGGMEDQNKMAPGKALKLSIQELISQDTRTSSRRNMNF